MKGNHFNIMKSCHLSTALDELLQWFLLVSLLQSDGCSLGFVSVSCFYWYCCDFGAEFTLFAQMRANAADLLQQLEDQANR